MQRSRRSRALVALVNVSLIAVAASCGGGDGGGGSTSMAVPASPHLMLAYGPKALQFSWAPVPDATTYKLFVNPDGASGYSQTGDDIAGNSVLLEISVARLDWTNVTYALEACNSLGCSGMSSPASPLSGIVSIIGYFKASNTKAFNGQFDFGSCIALSADGHTLVVGARGEPSEATGVDGNQSDSSQPYAGAVYIFTQSNGIWSQRAYIKPSNTLSYEDFGTAVAISADGSTIAVGADGESSSSRGISGNQTQNCVMCFYGAVYVFTNSNGSWSQQAYIKASNSQQNWYFGYAVTLSGDGNTLAVGAVGEASDATGINGNQSDMSAPGAGAVYVFSRSLTTWTQQAYVKSSNTEPDAAFGDTLALSADGATLAVGATGETTAPWANPNAPQPPAPGVAYVFTQSNGMWAQQARLLSSNSNWGQVFGRDIALSSDGNTLAVGAIGDASGATGVNGNQSDTSAPNAGAAFIFVRSGVTWTQEAYVKASNTQASQYFGAAIALSEDGSTLAVGAVGESSGAAGVNGDESGTSAPSSGATYVFANGNGDGQWAQQAYVKASNPRSASNFGYALALSGDGSTLAATAPSDPSGATGIDGSQTDISTPGAGAAYLY